MSPRTRSQTEEAVLRTVTEQQNGITARDLADSLTREGYAEDEVQRAMQRALDRGFIELGPKLQLIAARVAAA